MANNAAERRTNKQNTDVRNLRCEMPLRQAGRAGHYSAWFNPLLSPPPTTTGVGSLATSRPLTNLVGVLGRLGLRKFQVRLGVAPRNYHACGIKRHIFGGQLRREVTPRVNLYNIGNRPKCAKLGEGGATIFGDRSRITRLSRNFGDVVREVASGGGGHSTMD